MKARLYEKILLGMLFCCVASPSWAEAIFYKSAASHEQTIDLEGVKTLRIECYCPYFAVNRVDQAKQATLALQGEFSIAGYHGSRENAGAKPLKPERLNFKMSQAGSVKTLRSPESRYIHHALVMTQVKLALPPRIALEVRQAASLHDYSKAR